MLSDLKNSGVRLGLISNTANLTRAKLKQLLPLDFDFNVFEANLVLLSSEIGIEKPSLEIFELGNQSNRHISLRVSFIALRIFRKTLGAQRVGMVGARIQPPPNSDLGTFVDFLRKLKFLQ